MTQNKLSLLWEAPLAILSFLFYKLMKFVIGNLYTIYLFFNQEKSRQWRILSAETLDSAMSLPVLMTKGPRWNTHAIIGTLGPFSVNSYISLERELADMSAKSWFAVVYSFPDYQTIANISSDSDLSAPLSLKPGKYTLGLRYYNYSDKVVFPAVTADGVQIVNTQECPGDVNNFYHSLIKRESWFYRFLHYYIFTLLQWQKFLPKSLVRREYLPVGAPDTNFFYGALSEGEILQMEISPAVLRDYEIYITLYNRASFPLSWWQQKEEIYKTKAMPSNGFYLLRVRKIVSSPSSLKNKSALKWHTSRTNNITIANLKEYSD